MKLVYKSKFYTLSHADNERCFYLDIGPRTLRLSFCQLLALRHKLFSIPIESHFYSDLNKHGFELIFLCNKEHLLLLDTLEILDMRELLQMGFALLEFDRKPITV